MSFPINRAIKKYASKQRISFSMPGHKGKDVILPKDLFKLDVTELSDTDDLMAPENYIRHSMEKLSKIYKTKSTHYLLGGSTSGIYAMVSLAVKEGDKIIVDRFCHKSVINAIIFQGAIPVYITPQYNYQFSVTGGILPAEVESAIESNPDAKAVLITSPTYYGTVSDVKAIADLTHKANMLLLVDEAHGAHFHISRHLPENAVNCGADMSVQSVHKTLGAMSGGALLHINTDKFIKTQILEAISMHHTSSPSYASLCVLEGAVYSALKFEKDYETLIAEIDKNRQRVNAMGKAYWIGEERIGSCGVFDIDKTRIVINFSKLSVTGYAVAELLRDKCNIEVEMSDENNIVCIVTPYNKISHVKKLADSIVSITKKMKTVPASSDSFDIPSPIMKLPPRKAYNMDFETVYMQDAVGKIAKNIICKYPPGIPLIVPGEEITAKHIKIITDTIELGGNITGIEKDYKINIIK